MRFKTPLVALSAAGMLSLAACGGGTSEGPGDISSELENVAGKATDPTAVGPLTIEGATPGGTVTVVASAGTLSTGLDPSNAYYSDVMSVETSLILRSLTQWKYDEETGNQVLVPDLSVDLGVANDDYTEWTFTLKDGIKYQDGTPIVAADIEYAVERSLDCATNLDCPANYLIGDSGLLGAGDGSKAPGDIAGVEATDEKTIVFKFAQPFPDMAYYGFFPLFSPIPADNPDAKKAGYERKLVASGPYQVEEYSPGKKLVLVRNEHWDASTDPGRAALPDKWVFDNTSDIVKIDAMLLADQGDAQTTLTYDDIDAADYPAFKRDAADRLVEGPQPLTSYLAPDYRKITDKKIREALAYAYPYEAAFKAAGAILGVTRIYADQILPPGVPGRVDYNYLPDHELGTTDPAKAKALLQEAGAEGFELVWPWFEDGSGINTKVKDILVKAYKEAGFTPKPYAATPETYSDIRKNPDLPINLRAAGWFSDWPSGGTWFPPLLTCGSDWKGADLGETGFGSNYAAFCEETVDAKVAEIKASPLDDQPKLWGELDQTIMEEYMPWIPLYNGGTVQAHGSKIKGHEIDVTGGMPTLKIIWVQQ